MKKLLIVSLLCFVSSANAAYHNSSACPENSGTWYDPQFNGEGITVQQVDADKLVLYRYHAWPIFDYKTGNRVSTVGGYASGLLTRHGQIWEGTITAYKGPNGPLLWKDALIDISPTKYAASKDILDQPVQYKVSGLRLDSNNGTVRITILSPYQPIADQDMYFRLERLVTPDCWYNNQTVRRALNNSFTPTEKHFRTDIQTLRSSISRMVTNIIHVLHY